MADHGPGEEPRAIRWSTLVVAGTGKLGEMDCSHVDWGLLGVGPALKWANDFVFFRYPRIVTTTDPSPHLQYAYDLEDIHRFSGSLGMQPNLPILD